MIVADTYMKTRRRMRKKLREIRRRKVESEIARINKDLEECKERMMALMGYGRLKEGRL